MQFAVVLVLGLVGTIALIVFVTAKRRVSTWLIVGAVCMIGTGGVVWSHEHRGTTTWTDTLAFDPGLEAHTTIAGSHPVSSHSATVEFIALPPPIGAGSGPNHAPAIALFAAGGAMGATALIMIRRRARSAPSR